MARKIIFILFAGVFIACLAAPIAQAQGGYTIPFEYYPPGAPTISGKKPTANEVTTTEEVRQDLTSRVVNILTGVAGTIAVFFIIQNAFGIISAAGSEEKLGQHKKGLTWAIVGLLLIILSYSIIRFIISVPFQADEATLEQSGATGGGGAAPAAGGGAAPAGGGVAPRPANISPPA